MHTVEILKQDLGYEDTRVDALLNKEVVTEQWAPQYLPSGNPWDDVASEYSQFLSEHIVNRASSNHLPDLDDHDWKDFEDCLSRVSSVASFHSLTDQIRRFSLTRIASVSELSELED